MLWRAQNKGAWPKLGGGLGTKIRLFSIVTNNMCFHSTAKFIAHLKLVFLHHDREFSNVLAVNKLRACSIIIGYGHICIVEFFTRT